MKKKFRSTHDSNIDIVFEVDEDNVKEEWTRQAALYQRYGVKAIKSTKIKRKLNLKLSFAIAQLDKNIREKPSKYFSKGCKLTEPGIKNVIEFDKNIGKIRESIIKQESNVDLYTLTLKSLEHRKKSLEFFGQIYLSSLYSEPKESRMSDSKVRKSINKMRGGDII